MKTIHYTLLLLLSLSLLSCEDEGEADCAGDLALTAANVTPAFCGQTNGSFSVTPANQNGSVTYQLDNGSFQSSADFTGLAPGTYQVTAKDDRGCTATASVAIASEDKTLAINATATDSECGKAEGSLTLEVSGGNAPYEYSLDSTTFKTENTFTGLEPGTYTVVARDKDGCASQANAVVLSGISFSNTVSSIISTNCAVSNCHDGSRGIPNFTEKSTVIARAAGIKTRTGNKVMPPPSSGRSLTDEQIQQIACWVNDGAKDN